MITEDYVSFETAMLLNEKGFSERTASFYKGDGAFCSRIGNVYQPFDWNHDKFVFYSAPNLQMTMKWLREVHHMFIEICTDKAHNFKDIIFRPAIYDKELNCLWESDNFSTYEQACEAGIKYCLENLI